MSRSRRKTISHLDLAEFLSGIEESKTSDNTEGDQFYKSNSEPIGNISSAFLKSNKNSNRQTSKEIQLVRDYCRIKCRSKVTEVRQWEEVRKVSLSLQEVASYNLIAGRFIHPQKHYHPIGSVDNKRAILTGLSGMLADADVHRKADTESTERFTRCKSVKSKNSYQYIDLDSEEAIAFEEYENRYAQYVLSNKPPAPSAPTTSILPPPPLPSPVNKRMEAEDNNTLPFDDKENMRNISIANQPLPDIHNKPKKRKHSSSQQSTTTDDNAKKNNQQRRQTLSPSTARRLLIEEAELQMTEQQNLITLDLTPLSTTAAAAEEPQIDLLDQEISDFLMKNNEEPEETFEKHKKHKKHKKGGGDRRSTLSPSAARAIAIDLLDTEEEALISLTTAQDLPVESGFLFSSFREAAEGEQQEEEEEPLCARSAEDCNIGQETAPTLTPEYSSSDCNGHGAMDDDQQEVEAAKALTYELDLVLSDVNDDVQVNEDFDGDINSNIERADELIETEDDEVEEEGEIASATAAVHSPPSSTKKHAPQAATSPSPVQPEFDGFGEVKTSSPLEYATPNNSQQRWANERSFTPAKLVEVSPTTAFFGRKSEGDILQQGLHILEKAASEIEGFELLESFVANSLAPSEPAVPTTTTASSSDDSKIRSSSKDCEKREVSFLERFTSELTSSSSSAAKELSSAVHEDCDYAMQQHVVYDEVVQDVTKEDMAEAEVTATDSMPQESTAMDESGGYGEDIDEMAWEIAAQRRMRERFARARWQYLWEVVSAQAANKAITHAHKRQKTAK